MRNRGLLRRWLGQPLRTCVQLMRPQHDLAHIWRLWKQSLAPPQSPAGAEEPSPPAARPARVFLVWLLCGTGLLPLSMLFAWLALHADKTWFQQIHYLLASGACLSLGLCWTIRTAVDYRQNRKAQEATPTPCASKDSSPARPPDAPNGTHP